MTDYSPALVEVRDEDDCVICTRPVELIPFYGPPWNVCTEHYEEVKETMLSKEGAAVAETETDDALWPQSLMSKAYPIWKAQQHLDDAMTYDDDLAPHPETQR